MILRPCIYRIVRFLCRLAAFAGAACLAVAPLQAQETTNFWTGSSDRNWFVPGNWSLTHVPTNGEHVVVTNTATTIVLTNLTAELASFTITNATLTCSNWFTALRATNVLVQSNGVLTLPPGFTTSQVSNRVRIVCHALRIEAGGTINAKGRGFAGNSGLGNLGYGPGGGAYCSGGGYGGKGGDYSPPTYPGGSSYGSSNAPVNPGSGGGGYYLAANGGGAVSIEATGLVTIEGQINADGDNSNNGGGCVGGGSGGGIDIVCGALSGTVSGVLSARGGSCNQSYASLPGGGGRIAFWLGVPPADRPALLANLTNVLMSPPPCSDFPVALTVTNGLSYDGYPGGAQPGTIVFHTTNLALAIRGVPAPYGSPAPRGYGLHTNISPGLSITNAVGSPTGETNGFRRVCDTWSLQATDGSVLSSGSSTQAEVVVTQASTLVWQWHDEWRLTVSPPCDGAVTNTAGIVTQLWVDAGAAVTLWPTPSNGYSFGEWFGDVPPGRESDNPLVVTMDQARAVAVSFASLAGVAKRWNGTGPWTSVTNWTPAGMPGSNDDATIESGSVLLSAPRSVHSIVVSNNATLTFTNWSTVLTATQITVRSNGTITLPPAFTTSSMSNRVHLVCSGFVLQAGGVIQADQRGYAGGTSGHTAGYGPGGGSGQSANGYGGGGGAGGPGGTAAAGDVYPAGGPTNGTVADPMTPGSGGGAGAGSSTAGKGGGVVWIECVDATLDGTVSASGSVGNTWSGGGAGGSIRIQCTRLLGGSGTLRANGANGTTSGGGGGGGGRIALQYAEAADEVLRTLRLEVIPGNGGTAGDRPGNWGTVWCSTTNHLSDTLANIAGYLSVPGFTNWTAPRVQANGAFLGFHPEAFVLSVTGNIDCVGSGGLGMRAHSHLSCDRRIHGEGVKFLFGSSSVVSCAQDWIATNTTVEMGTDARLTVGTDMLWSGGRLTYLYTNLSCGGQAILTNGAILDVSSGPTNAAGPDYGALVDIGGELRIGPASWIYPRSHATNGGSVLFRAAGLWIGTNGGFNANGMGFAGNSGTGNRGYGPGGGQYCSGGGYGGKGGDYSPPTYYGGSPYGSTNAPIDPGSGGGGFYLAASGGGVIRVEVRDAARIEGTLTANGNNSDNGGGCVGGGAGGTVFLLCQAFSGSSQAVIRARGGSCNQSYASFPGGGGRVAIWYEVPEFRRAGIRAGTDTRNVCLSNASPYYAGTVSVTNGLDFNSLPVGAEPGSIVFLRVRTPPGIVLRLE